LVSIYSKYPWYDLTAGWLPGAGFPSSPHAVRRGEPAQRWPSPVSRRGAGGEGRSCPLCRSADTAAVPPARRAGPLHIFRKISDHLRQVFLFVNLNLKTSSVEIFVLASLLVQKLPFYENDYVFLTQKEKTFFHFS